MSSFTRSRWCRSIALLLALAVLHSAPGLAAYSALAANLKTAPVAGGNAVAPIRVAPIGSMTLVAPHHGLMPGSLTPSLNTVSAAPLMSAPSNAPAAAPLALAAPAAALLPASQNAPAAAPATAVGSLQETAAAIEAAKTTSASALSAAPVLGRFFEGWRTRPDALPPVVAPHDAPSFTPLAAPADSPETPSNVPSPSVAKNDAPRSLPVGLGLALAIGGGVGAWYAAPILVPLIVYALGSIPFVTVPALPLLAYTSVVTALGAAAGFAAFSTRTWANFPADLRDDAVGAARTTFRFWARFGMIFDSVLRGKSTDEVMNGEVSGNIFKHAAIAWPFVAVGYVFVPVAFVLGAAWRVVGTPILAAFRGAKDVIVGFIPWMSQVIDFAVRLLRNIVPFVGGFLWGVVRGLFAGGFAGAVMLAGPIYRDAVRADYTPYSLPAVIGHRLLQLAALLSVLVVGAAGFVVGVLVSPLHALLSGLKWAFDWSDVSLRARAFFARWDGALRDDEALKLLVSRPLPVASVETLNARRVRLLNNVLIAAPLLLALPFVALATLIRSVKAAFGPKRDAVEWELPINGGIARDGKERVVAADASATPAIPLLLGLMGASGAVYAYSLFGASLVIPAAWLALLPWAVPALVTAVLPWVAAALLGAGVGFALSQPKSLGVIPGRAVDDVKDGAAIAWGAWTEAGRRTVQAVLGTDKAAPLGTFLGFIPALVMAALSGLSSLSYALVTGGIKASWTGFQEGIRQILPLLRRFADWALEVLKNIVPFAAGFVWGAFTGFLKTAISAAAVFFIPAVEAFQAEDDARTKPSEAQITAGVVLALTILPLALAVAVGGVAIGATLGLPFIVAFGISKGVQWSKPSESSIAYWRAWERTALPHAVTLGSHAFKGVFKGVGDEMPAWRVFTRVTSSLLGAPSTALVLIGVGAKAFSQSFRDAKRVAAGGDLGQTPAEPTAPSIEPSGTPLFVPAGKPPVVLAAVAGLVGLAAGAASAFFFGLPFLAGLAGWTLWAGYAAVFAGLPLMGLATGLALTQPVFWANVVGSSMEHGKAGMSRSYAYWRNSADSALKSLFGVERGSLLTIPHRLVGGVLGLFWAVGGMLYGAGAAFFVGAYEGARQVVYEILPALRVAFETVMKVLRRAVPFVFGLVGGLIGGVIGSAAFGALLLGRPYFQHVVTEDFYAYGVLGKLGNLFLKLVAGVLGVLFGAAGAAIGVLVAAPYALTAAPALAFRFADIGGPAQRFFDHWSYGALRQEMRRINQLTSKFRFEDAKDGKRPTLAAGWIRMANVLPATIAAVFAAGIAGLVSYFRSLGAAYKSSTSGQPIPEPTVDAESNREWERTWSRSGSAARGFFKLGAFGAAVGAGLWAFSTWTPLGLAGWLLVGAAAGLGVALALTLAAGFAVFALILWISGQLR